MAWSDAAREAAIAARRAHAKAKEQRVANASATYKPSNRPKQLKASAGEQYVASLLRTRTTTQSRGSRTYPVDSVFKRAGHLYGVEIKTLVDQRNSKITMHPSSRLRKVAWAAAAHASLHTVAVDTRGGSYQLYYRHGVGSFRVGAMSPVATGAELKRMMGFGKRR